MKFDPNAVTEKVKSTFDPWQIGEYDFEVAEAEERQSKAGNDMIAVRLNVFNAEGGRCVVFFYILSNQVWKLKQFAEATGMLADFEAGEMSAELMVGRTGRVKLGIEPAQNGYEAKNSVKAFLPGKQAPKQAPARMKVPAGDLEDEIPF
jgi:hypothetical protein